MYLAVMDDAAWIGDTLTRRERADAVPTAKDDAEVRGGIHGETGTPSDPGKRLNQQDGCLKNLVRASSTLAVVHFHGEGETMQIKVEFWVHEAKGGYVLANQRGEQVAVATGMRSLRARVGEFAADQVESMVRASQEDEQSIKSAKTEAGTTTERIDLGGGD